MIIDYGAGAEVGSTFTAKFAGLFVNVPGIHAAGGLEIITGGVVIGFDENGLPLLDFGDIEVLVDHVNLPSAEELDAAICGALTA